MKLKNLLSIYVIIITCYKFRPASGNFWMDILVNKFTSNSKLYQVTMFTNHSLLKTYEESQLVKKIAMVIPTVTVDVAKLESHLDNRSLSLPIFKNPRASTTYVILISEMNDLSEMKQLEELQRIFLNFTRITRTNMRPKCLIISFKKPTWLTYLLKWAWSKKFLDFSVINVSINNETSIFSFNPFNETLRNQMFSENIELFEDKLVNTNRYSYKIPSLILPPYIKCLVTHENRPKCGGFAYNLIELVTSKINMEIAIDYKIDKKNYGIPYLDKILDGMESGNVSMMPYITSADTINHGHKNLKSGRTLYIDQMSCIISKASTRVYTLKFDNMVVLMIDITFVGIGVFMMNRLKLLGMRLNMFEIVKILFGQSSRLPVTCSEKVVYFSILTLSITYFSDFFLDLINIQISNENKILESFKDIYETELIPRANRYVYNSIFNNDDEYSEKVKRITVMIPEIERCVKSVIEGKNFLCLIMGTRATMFMEKYKESKNLKQVDLKIFNSADSFLFEEALPYLEKFNKIMLQVIEAGFIKELNKNQKTSVKHFKNFEDYDEKDGDDYLWIYLCVILVVGCSLSLIVFLFELLQFSYSEKIKFMGIFGLQFCYKIQNNQQRFFRNRI